MPDSKHRHRFRTTIICLIVAFATSQAMANPPPWLRAETLPSQAQFAIDQMYVGRQLSTTPASYDSKTQTWSFSILLEKGSRVDVTLDENTGDVCARYPGQRDCGGKINVKQAIDDAKADFARREDARLHPAPDIDDLRLMLIHRVQEGSTRPETWYVSLADPGHKDVDPSPGFLAKASSPQVTLRPISTMPEPKGADFITRLNLGPPLRRPDGDYDVTYGVWTMSVGQMGGGNTYLRVHHDASGWHIVAVLATEMV